MIGGESSSVGMLFYDTGKDFDKAVFCHFVKGRPVIEKGEKSALAEKMNRLNEKNKCKDNFRKYIGIEVLIFTLITTLVWIFVGGFFPVAGAFLFSVLGWFPWLVLFYAFERIYIGETFETFRRFHGAEHMMVSYAAEEPETFDFETAKKYSHINRECGTVYAASGFILSAVFGIAFGLIPEIGFWAFLGIIFGAAVLLLLNILFNPFNPLTLFQRKVTAKPDEETFLLAFEGMKKLVFEFDKE